MKARIDLMHAAPGIIQAMLGLERQVRQFPEDELMLLSLAIVSINGWNRLNIAARTVPGDYVTGSLAKLHAAPPERLTSYNRVA